MTYQPILNASGNQELINAIMKHVRNQRKCEKSSIAYMIGMMDAHSIIFQLYENFKRNEIIEKFESLINTKKINRLNNGYCLAEIFSQFQSK